MKSLLRGQRFSFEFGVPVHAVKRRWEGRNMVSVLTNKGE